VWWNKETQKTEKMNFTDEQILSLIEEVREWAKRSNKKNAKRDEKYFSDVHLETSEHAKHLSYHAQFNVFPEDLINAAAPNETREEYEYRKANYKQVTKPAWDKALSFIYRIFNEQNYTIDWKEDDYKEYFNYYFPKVGSYVDFFRQVVTPMKFADPNAVMVVKPYDIPTKLEYDEEGNEFMVADQSKEIDPFIQLFKSKKVLIFQEGEFCLCVSDRKTEVTVSGKKKMEGLFLELYDANNIYYIRQYGERDSYLFELELYYSHNWDYLPAWRLGGIPMYSENEYYYHSYFSGALPNLDQAAIFSSTQFGVISKVAYPTRWYYSDDCSTCNGNGFELDLDGEGSKRCTSCGGTGKSFTWSWGKDFEIPMPANVISQDTTQLPTPPFGMVDIGTNAIEFLDKKVADLIEGAFANLNIDISNAPNGQTATETKIDREEAFSFLLQVSGELFGLLLNSLNAMAYMRYGDSYENNMIEVVAPNEFTIRSSDALTKEFSDAMTAGLPVPYLSKLLKEGMKQRFKGSYKAERIVEIVTKLDSLMTKTDMEIISLLGGGVIQKWQAVLHSNIYNMIDEEQSKNEEFIFGDIFADIFPVLKGKAEEMAVTANVRTAEQILAEQARNNA
jgi:hypothetical protein